MSVEITDQMIYAAVVAAGNQSLREDRPAQIRAALEAAARAIQEAVAYRIASKLNTLSTERAQADDMNASRNFKQAADVAVRVAKGGW